MATPGSSNATSRVSGGDRVSAGRTSTRRNTVRRNATPNNPTRPQVTRRPAPRGTPRISSVTRDLLRSRMQCPRDAVIPLVEMDTNSDED